MNFHEFTDHYADVFEEVEKYLRFVVDETDRELEIVGILARIITKHAAKWVWANKSILKEARPDFIKALISGFALPIFIDTYHHKFDNFGPKFLELYKNKASFEDMEKVVLQGIGVLREITSKS